MLLSIEIFDGFKIQQRISGFLVVGLISLCHFFESRCSPLCEVVSKEQIHNDRTDLNQQKHPREQRDEHNQSQRDFHENREDIESAHPEDCGERLRSF